MDREVVGWSELGLGARMFRIAHGVWGAINLAGLAYIIWLAARRRRDRAAYVSAGVLAAEGVALIIGRGDCPFGDFQARLGDPVPMFEWVLPPRAAKAAIPVLTIVALIGLGSFALRTRQSVGHKLAGR